MEYPAYQRAASETNQLRLSGDSCLRVGSRRTARLTGEPGIVSAGLRSRVAGDVLACAGVGQVSGPLVAWPRMNSGYLNPSFVVP